MLRLETFRLSRRSFQSEFPVGNSAVSMVHWKREDWKKSFRSISYRVFENGTLFIHTVFLASFRPISVKFFKKIPFSTAGNHFFTVLAHLVHPHGSYARSPKVHFSTGLFSSIASELHFSGVKHPTITYKHTYTRSGAKKDDSEDQNFFRFFD